MTSNVIDTRKIELLERRMTGDDSTFGANAQDGTPTTPATPLNFSSTSTQLAEDTASSSRPFSKVAKGLASEDEVRQWRVEDTTGCSRDGEDAGASVNAAPTRREGRFSKEEDDRILAAVAKHGTDWDRIVVDVNSDEVLPRSKAQIMSRYHRKLKPNAAQSQSPSTLKRTADNSLHSVDSMSQPLLKRALLAKAPAPISQLANDNSLSNAGRSVSAAERVELDREWENIRSARAKLAAQEASIQEHRAQLDALRGEHAVELEKSRKRFASVLVDVLVEKGTLEKALARRRVHQDSLRLGHQGTQRHGTTYCEVWHDGSAFVEATARRQSLQQQRQQLEQRRKACAKKQRVKASAESVNGGGGGGGGTSTSTTTTTTTTTTTPGHGAAVMMRSNSELEDEAQFMVMEEQLRVRLAAIKRDEQELAESVSRLNMEKMLHARELKRVADEEQSRFNNMPLLQSERYLLLTLLGKGGFSEVYLAYDLVALRTVACKIHQLNSTWSNAKKESYTRHAWREYTIQKELRHHNIVQMLDVFGIDENSFCTVLEYCDGGDLDSYLKQRRHVPEREARFIIKQVLNGLRYLNEQARPIIHYDLKPGNIIFSGDGSVKITDFGLSKMLEEDQHSMDLTSQGAGTYWYLPPECFEGLHTTHSQLPMSGEVTPQAPKISSKVDVWSVGVIFYQLIFGKKPFGHNLSQQSILKERTIQAANKVEFPSKPALSPEGKAFIQQLLTHSHHARPTVFEAGASPYLNTTKTGKKKNSE